MRLAGVWLQQGKPVVQSSLQASFSVSADMLGRCSGLALLPLQILSLAYRLFPRKTVQAILRSFAQQTLDKTLKSPPRLPSDDTQWTETVGVCWWWWGNLSWVLACCCYMRQTGFVQTLMRALFALEHRSTFWLPNC